MAKKRKPQKKSLGINHFEMLVLLVTLYNQLKHSVNPGKKNIALKPLLLAMATFIEKAGHKADKEWQTAFSAQADAFRQLSNALNPGGIVMKKIELGITPKELIAMIPGLIADIWPLYMDDQKITADEGVLIAAALFDALADPTDDEFIKAFFTAQGAALRALAPLFEVTEE